MSHRGEGSVYYEKAPPDKAMSSPSDSDTPRGTARRASDPHEGRVERKLVLTPPEKAMPDPSRMKATQPPPPPPLPGSGFGDGAEVPSQSELAKENGRGSGYTFLGSAPNRGSLEDHSDGCRSSR